MTQKTAETTGDSIGNKVTRVSKTSPKNNSETNDLRLEEEYF